MPSGRGTGHFPPVLPVGQGGEMGAKAPSPLAWGRHWANTNSTVSHQPGTDSPPKPPAIAPWSFASATGPVPRRPAAPPLCRSSAGGQRGEDVPMSMQAAPAAWPAAYLHFLQPLEAPRQAREAGLHHGFFHLGEDGVGNCLKSNPGSRPQHGWPTSCPPQRGPALHKHPLTSSWKRP